MGDGVLVVVIRHERKEDLGLQIRLTLRLRWLWVSLSSVKLWCCLIVSLALPAPAHVFLAHSTQILSVGSGRPGKLSSKQFCKLHQSHIHQSCRAINSPTYLKSCRQPGSTVQSFNPREHTK